MQADAPREWAKPMNPRATGSEPYGSWAGKWKIFNIINRQMGRHYTLSDDANIQDHPIQGFQIVDSSKGDKERFAGFGHVARRDDSPLPKQMFLAPFYLLWMPTEKWNAIQAEEAERRRADMQTPTKMLLSQNPAQVERLQNMSISTGRNYAAKDPFYVDRANHFGESGYGIEDAAVIKK